MANLPVSVACGLCYGAHLEMGSCGSEDLLGPLLSKKNKPHPIILTLSSGAHKFSPFEYGAQLINGPVHSDLFKARGHVYYACVGGRV